VLTAKTALQLPSMGKQNTQSSYEAARKKFPAAKSADFGS